MINDKIMGNSQRKAKRKESQKNKQIEPQEPPERFIFFLYRNIYIQTIKKKQIKGWWFWVEI